MQKFILVSLMIGSVTSTAIAQCEAQSAVPVTNAPYSAVRRVITAERKADGATSRVEATAQEARDSKGRRYRAGERRWTTSIDGKSVQNSETLVNISDPLANTETTWDTTEKVVKIVHFPFSNAVASANHPNVDAFSFDATAKRLNGTTLGTKTIDGISALGIRYQTSKSTHECWFSPELKTLVLQVDEYPDRSFRNQLENIRLGEPDVSIYKPPSGYSENHVYPEHLGKMRKGFMLIAITITGIGVPVLLVLAYRGWVLGIRSKLPQWRNGVGFTALALVTLCWIWYVLSVCDLGLPSMPLFLDLSALAVLCTVLSALLALAWRGIPRLQAVGASLLLIVGYQFSGWAKLAIRLGS